MQEVTTHRKRLDATLVFTPSRRQTTTNWALVHHFGILWINTTSLCTRRLDVPRIWIQRSGRNPCSRQQHIHTQTLSRKGSSIRRVPVCVRVCVCDYVWVYMKYLFVCTSGIAQFWCKCCSEIVCNELFCIGSMNGTGHIQRRRECGKWNHEWWVSDSAEWKFLKWTLWGWEFFISRSFHLFFRKNTNASLKKFFHHFGS